MRLDKENKRLFATIIFAGVVLLLFFNIGEVWRQLCVFIGYFAPLLTGAVIAFLVNILLSPIERLWSFIFKKRGRVSASLKRPICLALAIVTVVSVIFAFLFIVIPELGSTFSLLIERLPQYISSVKNWYTALADELRKFSIVLPQLGSDDDVLTAKLSEYLGALADSLPDMVISGVSALASTLVNAVLGIVFSIYLLLEKEQLSRRLRRLFYAFFREKQSVDMLFEFITLVGKTFADFISRQALEAVLMGFMTWVGALILGMPYAHVLATVIGFSALVPMFGAVVGAATGTLIVLVTDPFKAVLFLIFIVILQQIEGNLVYPHVVGSSVGLSPLWVLAAVTVGGAMFGIIGIFISVPLTSVIYFTVAEIVNDRLRKTENKTSF